MVKHVASDGCVGTPDVLVHAPDQLGPVRDGHAEAAAKDKVKLEGVDPVALDVVDLEPDVFRYPGLVSHDVSIHRQESTSSVVVVVFVVDEPFRLGGTEIVPDNLADSQQSALGGAMISQWI